MKKNLAIATLMLLCLVGAAIADEQSYAASVTVNPVVSVTITACGALSFGSVDHNTNDNPVTCQTASGYAVNVLNTASSNTNIDVDTKSSGDFTGPGTDIPIGNSGWTEIDSAASETAMTISYSTVESSVTPSSAVNLFYWLDVPNLQTAGSYTSTFYVRGQ